MEDIFSPPREAPTMAFCHDERQDVLISLGDTLYDECLITGVVCISTVCEMQVFTAHR